MVVENPTPDDIPRIISADALLTARGGSTSHAAIALNSIDDKKFYGVMSVSGFQVDPGKKKAFFKDSEGKITGRIDSGDIVSLHGTSGEVYLGSRIVDRASSE